MSLQSSAQYFEVLDRPESENLVVLEEHESEDSEQKDHEHNSSFESEPLPIILEFKEPLEVEIVVDELPGAPAGTKDPEILEVEEESDEKSDEDNNDAKTKKNDRWDWASKGAEGFVTWIKERLESVPKHSGQDSAGLERAVAYLDKLDSEISKAMRLDLEGDLDANKVEEVRSKIDEGISRLHDRLDKIKKSKKVKRKKANDIPDSLIKEAQKITGTKGVYVTVPLLISGIARVCINGCVSAGHDITDIYKKQADKYKLNDRERSEVKWLLFDMGFPIRGDRGFMLDGEEYDQSSSDNFDWAANYQS